MDANSLVAKCLQSQGVTRVYGILGIPVIELANAISESGIQFYAFRNEQAASYAAGAEGYLTGRPGVCLTVSGPGLVHALAGLSNAKVNNWPMICIAGALQMDQEEMGGFQEYPQVESARLHVKWAARVNEIQSLTRVLTKAFRMALAGRPGPVYVDLPANLFKESVENPQFAPLYTPPLPPLPHHQQITQLLTLLRTAASPLIIFGKGASYAHAETHARILIEKTNLPFLPTPMAKGLVSDLHPNCVSAARSTAISNADVVVFFGARLNWILHFGMPPRFRADLKVVQVDIEPTELDNNVKATLPIAADVSETIRMLNAALDKSPYVLPKSSPWWQKLSQKVTANTALNTQMAQTSVLNYYNALGQVRSLLSDDTILMCEGANTMDIARTVLPSMQPRQRLDAGSFGTMGVGLGFLFAAKTCFPHKPVIGVMGDSAFGFSAMELETVTRYRLDMTIIIINNNGVFGGPPVLPANVKDIPPNALNPEAKYELLAEAFGGKGYRVQSQSELAAALEDARKRPGLKVINTLIDTTSGKKPQEHFWLSKL